MVEVTPPTPGRIVLVRHHPAWGAIPGSAASSVMEYPMIVTHVRRNQDEGWLVSGHCFMPQMAMWRESLPEGLLDGCWRWPPRA